MANEYKTRPSGTQKAKAGLCGLLALLTLASGCATPLCIKERRMLASQGRLNSGTYTKVEAGDNGYAVQTGIQVGFGDTKELKDGAAGACAAFGYGIIRPAFKEFWVPSKPEKFEYSGLTIFTGDGYRNGRTAESLGEWTRYAAMIGGIVASKSKGGKSDSDPIVNPPPEPTSTSDSSSGNTANTAGGLPPQPEPTSTSNTASTSDTSGSTATTATTASTSDTSSGSTSAASSTSF